MLLSLDLTEARYPFWQKCLGICDFAHAFARHRSTQNSQKVIQTLSLI